MREKLNILVHSEPKAGKTIFAVRKNPGVFVLDTEGSSKHVRGIERKVITSMNDMRSILPRIKSGEIKVVVIDTLDELVNNFGKQEVRSKGGHYVQRDGTLSQPGWGFLRENFLKLTRDYRDAGADVLTLCHSELKETPTGGIKWTLKLPSDYSREVMGMMDAIGFLEVYRKGDGTYGRRLNFEKTPMYDAGIRAVYDAVEDKFYNILPPQIEDASLVEILKAYDEFFEGKGEGYVTPCSNCAEKGKKADAVEMVANMNLCKDCVVSYNKVMTEKNKPDTDKEDNSTNK